MHFRGLALADVADRAGDERALLGLQRAEADLDRKFGSVLALPEKLDADTHRSHLRRSKELIAVRWVLRTEARRQEQLDLLTKHLGPRVAKELLGLRIDEHDIAGLVHDDDRIWSCFEQVPEFPFRLLALGDVADG